MRYLHQLTMPLGALIIAIVWSLNTTSFEALAQTTPFLITPYYGTENISGPWSVAHGGIDFGMGYEQVLASDSGSVTRVSWYNNNNTCHQSPTDSLCGYGLHIYIDHGNGYQTRYAHLSASAFGFGTTGTPVLSGQIIGTSGHTGWSTAPHLHFELRAPNGSSLDPVDPSGYWVDGEWATPSRPIPAPASAGETIVDDNGINGGGFSKGSGGVFNNSCLGVCGGWNTASIGYGSDMYYTPADRNQGPIDQWAKWQAPALDWPQGVLYEIFVHVPSNNATTWQAPYTIVHQDGTSYATVDQKGLSNQWVSIGTYRMKPSDYVYTHDAAKEAQNTHCTGWCQLGVDAVKFVRRGTTYVPFVRYDGNGTGHDIFIRSNGGTANVTVHGFNQNGQIVCGGHYSISAHALQSLGCDLTSIASFVIDSSQDVSVVAKNLAPSRGALDNSFTPAGNPSFEQVATTLYVHSFYKSIYNVNSSITIQNVGGTAVPVTMEFVGRTGYSNYPYTTPNNIAVMGQTTVDGTSFLPASWVGSVKITSSQPMAVRVYDDRVTAPAYGRTFNASASGQSLMYVPAAYRNQWGFNTGVVVQNLGSSSTNVTLTYCVRTVTDPSSCPTSSINGLAPLQAAGVLLSDASVPLTDGWTGSIKLQSSSGAISAAVTNSNSVGGYDFSATGSGGKIVYLPYAARRANGYSTGYTVRNIAGTSIDVQAIYYDENGTIHAGVNESFTLASAQAQGKAQIETQNLPDGWRGSIVLSATGNIVAVMRADAADSVSGYNGIAR